MYLKSSLSFSILVLLSLFVFSCGEKETVKQNSGSLANSNLPDWVLDPKVEGKLAAVGIAPASKGGLKVQLAQAESDARANIASQIGVEISRITKDAMSKANVNNQEDYQASFSQATKEVIKNLPLSGAVRKNIFRDQTDGSLYVHMVVEQENVKKYLSDSLKMFDDAMKSSGASSGVIAGVNKQMSSLFDELDLERGVKAQGSDDASN